MYFNIKAIISLNFYITYILLSASVPELFNRAKKKTPEHYLLNGAFEKSLAAAYFPT